MSRKDLLCEGAAGRFRRGYSCAQSVLLTMFEHWNEENEFFPEIATGFGGGTGRCGSVCGALTGGVKSIKVKYGTNEPSPEKLLKAYELARVVYREFGTTIMRLGFSDDLASLLRFPEKQFKGDTLSYPIRYTYRKRSNVQFHSGME